MNWRKGHWNSQNWTEKCERLNKFFAFSADILTSEYDAKILDIERCQEFQTVRIQFTTAVNKYIQSPISRNHCPFSTVGYVCFSEANDLHWIYRFALCSFGVSLRKWSLTLETHLKKNQTLSWVSLCKLLCTKITEIQ